MGKRYWTLSYTGKQADKLMKTQRNIRLYKRKIGSGANKGLYYVYKKK